MLWARAPGHGRYRSFATFSDPDGGRLLQEITTRLPGPIDSSTRRAALVSGDDCCEPELLGQTVVASSARL